MSRIMKACVVACCVCAVFCMGLSAWVMYSLDLYSDDISVRYARFYWTSLTSLGTFLMHDGTNTRVLANSDGTLYLYDSSGTANFSADGATTYLTLGNNSYGSYVGVNFRTANDDGYVRWDPTNDVILVSEYIKPSTGYQASGGEVGATTTADSACDLTFIDGLYISKSCP